LQPSKTIWLYTGYRWEDIQDSPLLPLVDVVVDGEFRRDEHDLSLAFRGSHNQRIIDVPASLQAGFVVEWKDDNAV
jgi:anaerobic ribonucleoside-triphosphate reductase activating protein